MFRNSARLNFLSIRLIFNLFLFTYVSIKTSFPDLGDTKLAFLNISFDSDVGLIRKMYGMSDAGSYLDIAISLANFRNIQPEQYFYIHTWSPGQSIVLALAILTSKFTFPVYVIIFLVNYMIWFFIITFLTKKLSSQKQVIFFYFFYLTFLFSSDFIYYFYTNMFHSEVVSNSLLFAALIFLSWLIKNQIQNWFKYAVAGFVLGFSVLVRYTSETGLFLLILLLSIWLFSQLLLTSRRKLRNKINQTNHMKVLRLTFISILIALLTTVPWRILNFTLYDMNTVRLSNASSWTIYGVWALDDSPEAQYWSVFGSNWACKIDPVKCESLNSLGLKSLTPETIGKEALKSVLKNPSSYVVERFKYMKIYYFGDSQFDIGQYQKYFSLLALLSGAYLLILLFNKKYWNYENFIISLIWTCFILNQFLMYSITHYEYRYFIIFKFLIFGFIFSLNLHVKNGSKISERTD
jgi:hypothetical protein